MEKITILSGKGGVGKSSITASLAVALSEKHKVICADCDVDASNLALVFGAEPKNWEKLSTNQKAVFDLEKCKKCKKCVHVCYFNAIKWDDKPILKQFSCEGCGACTLICPENAITLEDVYNAKIGFSKTKYGFDVVSAQLEIGESGSGKVVSKVKELANEIGKDSEYMLIDAAAGIGCPVIASVSGSNKVILVTEPTPSAFSDMRRALKMASYFRPKLFCVINKYDLNQDMTLKIIEFCEKNNIKVIAKFPYDKVFVKALKEMKPVIEYKYHEVFKKIIEIIDKI